MFAAEKGLHWFPCGQLLNRKIIPLAWPVIWKENLELDLKFLADTSATFSQTQRWS